MNILLTVNISLYYCIKTVGYYDECYRVLPWHKATDDV